MKKTNLAVTTCVAIVAALAVATAVKCQSTQIRNSWFDSDTEELRQLPSNLLILRPTQHSDDYAKICHYDEDCSLARTLGRNVTLRQVIGEACDCSPAQVMLPPDAPQGRFDFLITASGDAREHLQNLIQTEFNFSVREETQHVDVFILTVSDPALPGFAVSAADETSDINYDDGKLYFTREPMSKIVEGLSQGLNRLVLDNTGLTNNYDFSFAWSQDIEKAMENGAWNIAGARKALSDRGLALESGNVSTNVYLVTKTP